MCKKSMKGLLLLLLLGGCSVYLVWDVDNAQRLATFYRLRYAEIILKLDMFSIFNRRLRGDFLMAYQMRNQKMDVNQ